VYRIFYQFVQYCVIISILVVCSFSLYRFFIILRLLNHHRIILSITKAVRCLLSYYIILYYYPLRTSVGVLVGCLCVIVCTGVPHSLLQCYLIIIMLYIIMQGLSIAISPTLKILFRAHSSCHVISFMFIMFIIIYYYHCMSLSIHCIIIDFFVAFSFR